MRFGLILGDQLNHQLATLKYLNQNEDIILMAEVLEENLMLLIITKNSDAF